jgi:hypothetical protein
MARPRQAAPKEVPAAAASEEENDLDGQDFPQELMDALGATGEAQDASSQPAGEAASAEPEEGEGGEEPEGSDASSQPGPETAPEPDGQAPQAVKEARLAQQAADKRAAELDRRLRQAEARLADFERREAEASRRLEDEEFDRLAEEDPDALIAQIREQRRQAQTSDTVRAEAYSERDAEMVRMALTHADKLFPDLTQEDINWALGNASELAQRDQGRRALPGEVYAWLGEARVQKALGTLGEKDARIKELEDQVEALEAARTGDIVGLGEGPERPADGSPGLRINLDDLDALDDEFWDDDANEARVLAAERKRLGISR